MLRFPARRRKAVALPLTPVIDIVFQLLIYFLLTSSWVVEASIDVRLPETGPQTTLTEPELVVSVDRRGGASSRGSR